MPTSPIPAARWAVGAAARLLPTPADRRRYQAEFVAELYGRPVSDQLRHTVGVVSQAFALRAALGASSRSPEVPVSITTRAPFRCRVLRWHRWMGHGAPHHGHVRICTLCGAEQGPFNTPDERPPQLRPDVGT